jgi:hypothetical protein
VSQTEVASNVCFCCKTAVAVDLRGRVFASWRHIFPGSIRDIAMAVSSDGGKTFGSLARVSEDKWEIAGCPEDGPALAIDAGGTAHVVWPTLVDEGGQQQKAVFYATTTDGQTFSPRMRLSAPDQDEAAHPQIAMAGRTAVIVWDEPHGAGRRVLLRTVDASGHVSGQRVISGSTIASHPVISAAANATVVAWADGEGTTSAIAVKRVEP